RVEQPAAGVGVDLDELRTVVAEVKVVAEKDAARTVIAPRHWRSEIQRPGAKAVAAHRRFDRLDHGPHVLEVGTGEKHRGGREQMWCAGADRVVHACGDRTRLE